MGDWSYEVVVEEARNLILSSGTSVIEVTEVFVNNGTIEQRL